MPTAKSPVKTRLRYYDADRHRGLSNADRSDDLLIANVSDFAADAARYRLMPSRLVRLIADADSGDPREQAAVLLTLLEKEPNIAAHLNTRRNAALSKPWRVQSEGNPELAERITRQLALAGLQKALGHLLGAVALGYAGVVVDWLPGGAGVRGFRPISPDRWLFDEGGNPALIGATSQPIPLAGFPPGQVLYLVNDGLPGLPCRQGLLRMLLWHYTFKHQAFMEWNRFLEKFGTPFLLGKIPPGEFNDDKKRGELLKSLLQLRSDGAGVGTTETQMELLNGAGGSNNEAFEAHQRYCDETITLLILGQLASSDRGSGLSNGGMQEEVRQDIMEADCAMIMEVVQNQLLDGLCRIAYGLPDSEDMRFVIDCERPEDLNVRAERDERVARAAGCRLSRDYVMDKYGVELDEPDPAPPPYQLFGQAPRQAFSDEGRQAATAGERLIRAALARVVDEDALAAWRVPIESAGAKAFGDLDPEDPGLVEKFKARAPFFLAALPGLLDGVDARAFEDALQEAMLAGFLNGMLPPSFGKAGGTAK